MCTSQTGNGCSSSPIQVREEACMSEVIRYVGTK
jgi:hypothetical protein